MPSVLSSATERLVPGRVRARKEQERLEAAAAEEARREAEARQAKQDRIAARRAAMLAADPAVTELTVQGRGYYGRTVTSFTAEDARARQLHLVTDALTHAGVAYFLVPGRSAGRHVVGVCLDDRKAFLAAVRELYGTAPLYACRPGKEAWPEDAVLYADGALPTALKRARVIRFTELEIGPAGQVLSGFTEGCDVEFWQDGKALLAARDAVGENPEAARRAAERLSSLRTQLPESALAGTWVAPRPNAVSDTVTAEARIPATRRVRERSHPTFRDFFRPAVESVDFDIDVVYTWVDGSDPRLAAQREAYRDGSPSPRRIHARETGASRYTSHDELKYSLRSLEMYAPFVRNVYIVTDGQTPSWLDTSAAGVKVVDHKEIFSDASVLPVFNSHAIGTQLHHIDGLSERYLYFNDDVFLGRPVTAEHFFHGNGVAKLPFSPFQYGLGSPLADEPAPNSAGKNVRRLLLEQHGRFAVNKFMHTPHPQIRGVMREIEELFAEDVERTRGSRFRDVTDIAMGASLHHHHAYLTGRAVPGAYKLRYVDVAREDASARLTELLETRGFDFFCLNDVSTPPELQETVAASLHGFLETYFPFPGRFERQS
ncbi:stealth family protein [Streptomyces abyssomicinicus]|uniref:stealth family protein n=1 Tax=Streptomyces abyssomicinicus TaxID=574929 RepID=UPI00125061E0|nr:stealth family protein [Streptomyces abyssomicinicus]